MLNYTVRGHDLLDVKTIEELSLKAKEQGVYALQLALGMSFPQMPSDAENINQVMGKYMRNALSRNHVEVNILSCYINMIHPDLDEREQLLTKFESYLRHAKYFGATMVATETGCVTPEIKYTQDNFTDEAFNDMLQVINRLVQAGEKYKTIVGIEAGLNHPLYSIDRIKQMLAAIESDYLGIVLDTTNLISAKTYKKDVAIVEKAFQDFGDKIVAFHLKDYNIIDGKIVATNLGEGLIDYKAITAIIAKYKPYCTVVLEETKGDKIKKALELLNM